MKIRLRIQNYEERKAVICALADNGYSVRVEDNESSDRLAIDYYVVFEYAE